MDGSEGMSAFSILDSGSGVEAAILGACIGGAYRALGHCSMQAPGDALTFVKGWLW